MKHFFILVFLLKSSSLFAQPGALDYSFGFFGVAFPPFITQLSYGHDLALQPDGKILVTGHKDVYSLFKIFVVRYNEDGSPDPSFPDVVTSIGSSSEYANAIAVQTDGKIVVAGYLTGGNQDFLLFRLTSSGVYDSTFGTNGIVTTSFAPGTTDQTNAMVIQPDGKILIAGWTSTTDKDIALLRYNSDGSLDSTFGTNGKVSTDVGNTIQEAHDIALQPDGKILVAGLSSSTVTANDVAVFRYNSDGSLDPSFGTNGVAIPVVNATDDDAAFAMALQPDGKIVTVGYTYTNYTFADNLVVRLDSEGNLDTDFNGTGIIVSNSTSGDNIAYDVILQPDGKIVMISRGFINNFDFVLTRFNSEGSIDPSWGNSGYAYTPIGIDNDYPFAGVIQPDGRILVTGYYFDFDVENFIVVRYLNDIATSIEGIPDIGFLLYPQPASDVIHVRLNERISTKIAASIYSITSGLVRTVQASNEFSIETADLSQGIYLLRIIDEDNKLVAGRTFVID